jgi:hypothetical protein
VADQRSIGPPWVDRSTECIEASEIEPGIVVRLDPAILIEDGRVCHTQNPPLTRPGPFVCVAVEGDLTTWTSVTETPLRRDRLPLQREWRSGGTKPWRLAAQFLADGAALWRGPKEAFVAASWQEIKTRSRSRAYLSEEGLDAVRAEIEAQRHRRHRSCED